MNSINSKISRLILLAVATAAWAADGAAPATHEAVGRSAARVTTDYSDAKISLNSGPSTNRAASGYRNVAGSSELGVQIAVSSHSYRSGAMMRDESVCPLNRPFVSSQSLTNGWASSEYEHLPQWVWIHFPSPRRIDKVVLYATTLATRPVEFSGQYLHDGGARFDTRFHVQEARFRSADTLLYGWLLPRILVAPKRANGQVGPAIHGKQRGVRHPKQVKCRPIPSSNPEADNESSPVLFCYINIARPI